MKTIVRLGAVIVACSSVTVAGQAPAQPSGTSQTVPRQGPTQAPPTAQRPTAPPTAQTPPRPTTPAPAGQTGQTQPGQTAPAQPAPVRRPPAQPASIRGGLTITVTDPNGATLRGIHVTVLGATDRDADTNDSGQLNLPGLLQGNYRLRFSGEGVVTFEREVALRAGQILDVDVALTPAPKPPPPPAPAPAPAPAVVTPPAPTPGPRGQPQSLSVVELLEKEFVGRQPRRESLLSCSGRTRTTMLQINEPLPERKYEDSDMVYYVLAGEGTMRLNGRDSKIATNAFLSVPRGTSHSFERRGTRPLVLLAVLGGEPCELPK